MTPPSRNVPETESKRCAAFSTIGRLTGAAGSASTLWTPRVASAPSQNTIGIGFIVSLPCPRTSELRRRIAAPHLASVEVGREHTGRVQLEGIGREDVS